jgi:SRSO17 transposase
MTSTGTSILGRSARKSVSYVGMQATVAAVDAAGLDHYQVRSWRAWYAHITLSMLALA